MSNSISVPHKARPAGCARYSQLSVVLRANAMSVEQLIDPLPGSTVSISNRLGGFKVDRIGVSNVNYLSFV